MHIPITRRIRSIVVESLVHCHRGCEFELLRQRTFFYNFILYYLKISFITISKQFGLLNIALMTANNVDAFSGILHMGFRV